MKIVHIRVEWAITSVCLCSPKMKRMAMPRGSPFGSVSGSFGRPVEDEKRTVTGVEVLLKCGATDREDASLVGVKVPLSRIPRA